MLTKRYLYLPGTQVPVGNILPTVSAAVKSPAENFLPWLLLLIDVAAVFGATHATGAAVAAIRNPLWLWRLNNDRGGARAPLLPSGATARVTRR